MRRGDAVFNRIFNDMTIPGGYNSAYRFEYMFKTGRYSTGATYEFGPEYFKGEVSWIDALSDGDEYCVGNAYMGELTFSLHEYGDYSMIKPRDQIEFNIRLTDGTDTSAWVFIGMYMPVEMTHDHKTKKWNFKCFDLMYKYDQQTFLNEFGTVTFPMTYHEAVMRMSNLCGISVDWPDEADNMMIAEDTIKEGDTCRQVLAYMLLTIGANVRMRFEGAFGIYYTENLPPQQSQDAIITTGAQHISRFFPETGLFEEVYQCPAWYGLCDGVKMDDGRIFFAPQEDYGKMTIYDPQSGDITISNATVEYDYNIQWANYWCSVVIPDNKVVMIPYGRTTIGLYDITNDVWTDGPSVDYGYGDSVWSKSCLLPDGRIIVAPYNAPKIGIYNTNTGVFSIGPAHGMGQRAFSDAVLAPNGKVILVPAQQRKIGIYDPDTNTFDVGPDAGSKYGTGNSDLYKRGLLASTGKIILVPSTTNTLGIYDPIANAYTDGVVFPGGTTTGNSTFFNDGILLNDGKIFFIPGYSGNRAAIYNPVDNTYVQSSIAAGFGTDSKTGVLSQDGTKVIICPYSNVDSRFFIYNMVTDTTTAGTNTEVYNRQCDSAILAPDGDVLMFPGNGSNIIKYNYQTDTVTYIETGITLQRQFNGATAMPDGNIFLSAYSTINFGILDTTNYTYRNGPANPYVTGDSPYGSAYLTPDKTKVIMVPWWDKIAFGIYDIASNTFSRGMSTEMGWNSGVMLDNGKLVLPPYYSYGSGLSAQIYEYDYLTDTLELAVTTDYNATYNTSFYASNGTVVFFIEETSSFPIIIYDPQTKTYTTGASVNSSALLNYKDDQTVCIGSQYSAMPSYKYDMLNNTLTEIGTFEISVNSGGVYARIDNGDANYDALISEYEYNTLTDENLPVTGITMEGIDGEKFAKGDSTGLMLNVYCPWGTDSHADFLYTKLRGYLHVPVNLDNGIVNPLVEPNDIVMGNDSGLIYRISYTSPHGSAMVRVDCEHGKWKQYEFSGSTDRQSNENKKDIKKTERDIKDIHEELKEMRQIIIVPQIELSLWTGTSEGGATWVTTFTHESILETSAVIVSADINTQNALGQIYTKSAVGSVNIYITLEQQAAVIVDLMIIV